MPNRPKCSVCEKSFQTNAQLVQHSVSTNHGADRCCVPCSRKFGTAEALEAHSKSSVHIKPSSVHVGPPKKTPKVLRSSSPAAIARKQGCAACHRSFETNAQLTQHCLDSGHCKSRCCRPCRLLFGTKEALKAHQTTVACKASAGQDTNNTGPPTSQQQHFISCRGNNYRRVPQQEHSAVLEKLLARCHSTSSLQRHGYKIPQAGESHQRDGSSWLTQGTGDEMLPLPRKDRSRSARRAVAIDCEMVGVEGGESELVSLSVLDFLTGEQIIHTLVKPRRPILDWRTEIHGISSAVLTMARAKGETLDGWQSARHELFKHVDEETVLVGHALRYDLAVLHIRPAQVVDSIILAADAIFGGKGKTRYWGLGLKNVCSELLGFDIRENAPFGSSRAHDALEDALAAREVVLCCLEQPNTYNNWVAEKRRAFFGAQTRKATQKKRRKQQAQKAKANDAYVTDSEDEILRWEDVIDYEIWPKSPPDSD